MNNNIERDQPYLEHEKSFNPDWEEYEQFPGVEEITPLNWNGVVTFENYEENFHPDWNLDLNELFPTVQELANQETPFPVWSDRKKEKKVDCKKKEKVDTVIASEHEMLLSNSNLVKEVPLVDCKCINTSQFGGYEQKENGEGLFVNGIEMSLWENGDGRRMFLVGKSGDFLFIGRLSEVQGKNAFLKSEILFQGIPDYIAAVPAILYFGRKTNTLLKLLHDWSKCNAESLDRYLLLTKYKWAGIKPSQAWEEIPQIQNPLLYLITNAVLEHNRKSVEGESNESIREWIYKNTVIPRV